MRNETSGGRGIRTKSPSTCQPWSSCGGSGFPSRSAEPRLTIRPSRQFLEWGLMRSWGRAVNTGRVHWGQQKEGRRATLTSPPQSSHTACHAFGANFEASKVLWCGMFVLRAFQVVLSSGSMPSRVQTFSVTSAACSLVKARGILRDALAGCFIVVGMGSWAYLIQPWLRKCSFCSGVRTGSTAIVSTWKFIY